MVKTETRYSRNRIYISEKEQDIIRDYPILLAGVGIGSVIAECALRLGFENLTIIDNDDVELSNLNRQNYTENDISLGKIESLYRRLKSINKDAEIKCYSEFLTPDNLESYLDGQKICINALDFTSDVPLDFDKKCQDRNIPVLHPYNLGWGGLVTVVAKGGLPISVLGDSKNFNETTVVEYATKHLEFWGDKQTWIDDVVAKYKNEKEILSPPQLSIGCSLIASMCTHLLFNIATNKDYKKFPEFYLSSLFNN